MSQAHLDLMRQEIVYTFDGEFIKLEEKKSIRKIQLEAPLEDANNHCNMIKF